MNTIRSFIRNILQEVKILEGNGDSVTLPQDIAPSLEESMLITYQTESDRQRAASYDAWLQNNYKSICDDVNYVFEMYGFTSDTTGFNVSEEDLWRQAEASLYLLSKDRADMQNNSMPFPYRYALFIIAWENGEQSAFTAFEDYIDGVHEFYSYIAGAIIPDPATGRSRAATAPGEAVVTTPQGTPGEVAVADAIDTDLASKIGLYGLGVVALVAGVPQLMPAAKWLGGLLTRGALKAAGSRLGSALTPTTLKQFAGEVVALATTRADAAASKEFDAAFDFTKDFGEQAAYEPSLKQFIPGADIVGTFGYPEGSGVLKQPMGLQYRIFSTDLPVAWSNMEAARTQILEALKKLLTEATFEIPAQQGIKGSGQSFKDLTSGAHGNHPVPQTIKRNIKALIELFENPNLDKEVLRDVLNQAAAGGKKELPTKETIAAAFDNVGASASSNPASAPSAAAYNVELLGQFIKDPVGTVTASTSTGVQVRTSTDFTKPIAGYRTSIGEVGENLAAAVRAKYSGRTAAELDAASRPLTGDLADKAAQLWSRVPDIRKNVRWYSYRLGTAAWWTLAAGMAALRTYLGFTILIGGGTDEDRLVDQNWVLRNMLDGKIRKETTDSWTRIRDLGRFSSMKLDVGELDIDLADLVSNTDVLINGYGSNVEAVPIGIVDNIILAADQAIKTGGDAKPWAIPPFDAYLPIRSAQETAEEIRTLGGGGEEGEAETSEIPTVPVIIRRPTR